MLYYDGGVTEDTLRSYLLASKLSKVTLESGA